MTEKTKSFDSFYSDIYPKLEEIEELRLEGAKKLNKIYKIGAISIVIAIILSFILPIGVVIFFSIVMIFILLGMFFERVNKTSKLLKPHFKNGVIRKLLNYFYDDVRYIPRQRINIKLLQKSLLFKKKIYNNTGDDYTECRIGNTYISFSEVQTYSKSETYFFNGVFIAVKFNKSFKSKTIVTPNSSLSDIKRIKLNIFGAMEKASKVILEDSIFNKEFDVISEDQVESRYLLSTSLMQRLIDYKLKVNKKVSFSFVDNWVYVAIPTKVDLFEASIIKPITDKEFIKSSYDYFQLLTGLVEDLDLNTKIWK